MDILPPFRWDMEASLGTAPDRPRRGTGGASPYHRPGAFQRRRSDRPAVRPL